jgi:hypothetical protein
MNKFFSIYKINISPIKKILKFYSILKINQIKLNRCTFLLIILFNFLNLKFLFFLKNIQFLIFLFFQFNSYNDISQETETELKNHLNEIFKFVTELKLGKIYIT